MTNINVLLYRISFISNVTASVSITTGIRYDTDNDEDCAVDSLAYPVPYTGNTPKVFSVQVVLH